MAPIALMGAFGGGPLSRSAHPLTGAGALILLLLVPLIAPVGAFLCGLGHWAAMAIGLWIYSLWRPVAITFRAAVEVPRREGING